MQNLYHIPLKFNFQVFLGPFNRMNSKSLSQGFETHYFGIVTLHWTLEICAIPLTFETLFSQIQLRGTVLAILVWSMEKFSFSI